MVYDLSDPMDAILFLQSYTGRAVNLGENGRNVIVPYDEFGRSVATIAKALLRVADACQVCSPEPKDA